MAGKNRGFTSVRPIYAVLSHSVRRSGELIGEGDWQTSRARRFALHKRSTSVLPCSALSINHKVTFEIVSEFLGILTVRIWEVMDAHFTAGNGV